MNKQPLYRIFLIGLVCLIPFFDSHAQGQRPLLGLKGGLNFARITYSPESEEESIYTGFTGGVFMQLPVTENFSLRPEILYSERGSRSEWQMQDEIIVKNIGLQYIDLTAMATLNLGEAGYIELGPYAGYLLGGRMTIEPEPLDEYVAILSKDDFRTLDYGISAGLGFRFGMIMVGARYNYGLANVGKSIVAKSMLDNSNNRFIQLTVGIGI